MCTCRCRVNRTRISLIVACTCLPTVQFQLEFVSIDRLHYINRFRTLDSIDNRAIVSLKSICKDLRHAKSLCDVVVILRYADDEPDASETVRIELLSNVYDSSATARTIDAVAKTQFLLHFSLRVCDCAMTITADAVQRMPIKRERDIGDA
jgi:hypothetical protein